MSEHWGKQNIVFIWITDGKGWKNSLRPLEEYFNQTEFLLNLDMLQKGILPQILSSSTRAF